MHLVLKAIDLRESNQYENSFSQQLLDHPIDRVLNSYSAISLSLTVDSSLNKQTSFSNTNRKDTYSNYSSTRSSMSKLLNADVTVHCSGRMFAVTYANNNFSLQCLLSRNRFVFFYGNPGVRSVCLQLP